MVRRSRPLTDEHAAVPPSAQAPAVAARDPFWMRHGLKLAMLLAFLVYVPTISFDFVYDDQTILRQNPRLPLIHIPKSYLLTTWWNVYQGVEREYRPLTMTSFVLEYQLWGRHPVGYHALNILWYVALVGLLGRMVLALFGDAPEQRRIGIVTAALFAVHPLHVEVVSGIVGRAELMMATGFVLTLSCGWRVLNAPSVAPRWRWAIVSFFTALLSMGSKEHGVLLFPMTLLLACLPKTGTHDVSVSLRNLLARRGATAWLIGAVALALSVYFTCRFVAVGALFRPARDVISEMDNPLVQLRWSSRVASALSLVPRAAGLMLGVVPPSPDYSPKVLLLYDDVSDAAPMLGLLLLAAGAAGLWLWRRHPLAWFALGLMLVSYTISSNLIMLIGTIFADRLLFLPSAGCCLLLAIWLGPGLTTPVVWRRVLPLGLLAGLFLLRTATYLPLWRSDEVLFKNLLIHRPQSVRAWGGYSRVLELKQQYAEALTYIERAESILPNSTIVMQHIRILNQLGDRSKALELLWGVIARYPGRPEPAELLYSIVTAQGGKTEQLEQVLRSGLLVADVRYKPRFQLLYGKWLLREGREEEAVKLLKAAAEALPEERENITAILASASSHESQNEVSSDQNALK